MQREQVSIPKILSYILLAVLYFALQSSWSRVLQIRGFHIDLLPCFVAAAALWDGPVEGVIMGIAVGLLYDVGFIGIDGVYPILFMVFGLIAGSLSRLVLSRTYVSMMMLSAAEMIVVGLLRYFCYLLPIHGASFGLVMQQVFGGAVLTAVFSFLVYIPVAKIGKRFDSR